MNLVGGGIGTREKADKSNNNNRSNHIKTSRFDAILQQQQQQHHQHRPLACFCWRPIHAMCSWVGKRINAWQPGNVNLVQHLQARVSEYGAAKGHNKKRAIFQDIYVKAIATGGRFLTRSNRFQIGYTLVEESVAKAKNGYMIITRSMMVKKNKTKMTPTTTGTIMVLLT